MRLEEAWFARLFLNRQAWIWEEGILRRAGRGYGPEPRRGGKGAPYLMHCSCCQFWAAALCLSHVVQWQRHSLQTAILLQGLCYVQ